MNNYYIIYHILKISSIFIRIIFVAIVWVTSWEFACVIKFVVVVVDAGNS